MLFGRRWSQKQIKHNKGIEYAYKNKPDHIYTNPTLEGVKIRNPLKVSLNTTYQRTITKAFEVWSLKAQCF